MTAPLKWWQRWPGVVWAMFWFEGFVAGIAVGALVVSLRLPR